MTGHSNHVRNVVASTAKHNSRSNPKVNAYLAKEKLERNEKAAAHEREVEKMWKERMKGKGGARRTKKVRKARKSKTSRR